MTDVTVPANISNGTISIIHVLLNQDILSNPQLQFIPFYTGVRGNQRHDVQPMIELTVPVTDLGVPNANTLNPFFVNLSSLEICDGTDYRILPLQFNLVSPSFYQLGEHIINIRGSAVMGPNPLEFATQLVVNVETNTSEYQPPSSLFACCLCVISGAHVALYS